MLLKATEKHKYRNIQTGELFDSIAVPTGFEKIYQLVEDTEEITEDTTTENDEILERLENVEKQSTKMQSEVASLQKVISTIQDMLTGFGNLTKIKGE